MNWFRSLIGKNPAKVITKIGEWKGDDCMNVKVGDKVEITVGEYEGRVVSVVDVLYSGEIIVVDLGYGIPTYFLREGGYNVVREDEEPPKSIEDMLVSLSREIVDLKKNQTELAYKLDEVSKRITDDDMAELGAEIVRVVERRLGNIERN